ncbi:hypothetical protein [Bradyrhizobium aeschynomenes]|uniref:hypothetical protein n=1 Tax=Bradyrhizobium aeschynomenes TaxID=2734909 RepID=UPI001AED87F8|nr:hypothetical protein [Bradyrhizobium aeschynomenes]
MANQLPGHMSSFFGDVQPELQAQFAREDGISADRLAGAAKAFADYSGGASDLLLKKTQIDTIKIDEKYRRVD